MTMRFTHRIPARAFGFQSDNTVLGFLPRCVPACLARTVAVDPNHTFSPLFFETMKLWWEWDDTRTPLYISGPTGCGKTTTAMQFLARVHAPVVTLTCRRRMDKNELIGSWGADAASGRFCWHDGPALTAWRYGYVLLINEFTAAPPEVWVSANDILEGDAIVNERTGEIVERHPNARVIITDNCRMQADSTTGYRGRHLQDMSVADRFWHLRADFLSPQDECRVLAAATKAHSKHLSEDLITSILRACTSFAAQTRRLASTAAGSTACPALSTRVLIRFTGILFALMQADSRMSADKLTLALQMSYANALETEAAAALLQLAHLEFAGVLDKL